MVVACVALAGAVGLAIVAVIAAVEQASNSFGAASVFRGLQVRDGDTLETRGGTHIRLLCIDAPEQDQPGGVAAQNALQSLISGGAKIQEMGKDSYGRLLAVVSIDADGKRVAVNTEMLRLGHAWVYRRYANDCGIPRRELCAAEKEAQLARSGLWREANPVPPWRWRKGATRPPNRLPSCQK